VLTDKQANRQTPCITYTSLAEVIACYKTVLSKCVG